MEELLIAEHWLAYTFAFLMGLSVLIYALLDGYDLGVGILTDNATWRQKDQMIASIGPFWDANETWLVLGVGILLVAFPMAHGTILTELYMPVAIMLFGLIFRGVAFDFRSKVPYQKKWIWNSAFYWGSLVATLAQGYMLGRYVIGFQGDWQSYIFAGIIALAVASGYCLLGACWLIMKTTDELQIRAIRWAKYHLTNITIGIGMISITTPMVSDRVFERWFSFPEFLFLSPIPIVAGLLIIALYMLLRELPLKNDQYCWLPMAITTAIYSLCFMGLSYSFFPYIIPEKLKIIDAASSNESLLIIFIGTVVVLPIIIGYTIFSYYVFRGKSHDLSYD